MKLIEEVVKEMCGERCTEEVIFVVSRLDCAYKSIPRLDTMYAGLDMSRAYQYYRKTVSSSDRTQVFLDMLQGTEAKRIEFFNGLEE